MPDVVGGIVPSQRLPVGRAKWMEVNGIKGWVVTELPKDS